MRFGIISAFKHFFFFFYCMYENAFFFFLGGTSSYGPWQGCACKVKAKLGLG